MVNLLLKNISACLTLKAVLFVTSKNLLTYLIEGDPTQTF